MLLLPRSDEGLHSIDVFDCSSIPIPERQSSHSEAALFFPASLSLCLPTAPRSIAGTVGACIVRAAPSPDAPNTKTQVNKEFTRAKDATTRLLALRHLISLGPSKGQMQRAFEDEDARQQSTHGNASFGQQKPTQANTHREGWVGNSGATFGKKERTSEYAQTKGHRRRRTTTHQKGRPVNVEEATQYTAFSRSSPFLE